MLTGFEPETTNNRMEMRAVLEALLALTEPVQAVVHTDSAYVANAFNEGWIEGWKRRGWKTSGKQAVKNRDLWERLVAETERHDVEFVKVKGHADDELNNRVDGLAVQAMSRGRQTHVAS